MSLDRLRCARGIVARWRRKLWFLAGGKKRHAAASPGSLQRFPTKQAGAMLDEG
jgi:hypothetical protein